MKRWYTKMMDWLDYVFYRISKFYIKHGEDFDGWRGYIYTSAMLSNLVCFIIMILFGVVRFKLSSVTAITFFYLLVFSLNLLLFHKKYTKQSFFKELSKQYDHERKVKLKGWVVLSFFVLSFLLFFFGLYVQETQFFRVPIR